jgi:hypothetical protein
LANSRYYFVRREMPNYSQARAAGWETPLFAYDDPRLRQQIAAAQAAGVKYGIWADPHNRSPEEYVKLMASLAQQYNPYVMVPDIEFIGKGDRGTPGWQYNDEVARLWRQYLPNQRTAITPMGNQTDFNYEAWNGIASEWLPQAYGADSNREGLDIDQVIQTLVNRGVDPNLITPVLARPNVAGYNNDYALWTYDDLMTQGLPRAGTRQVQVVQRPSVINPDSAALPRRPRLSQSQEQVAAQGLRWGGRTFTNQAQFQRYLAQHGGDFNTWAERHPFAAAGLAVRKRPAPRGAQ